MVLSGVVRRGLLAKVVEDILRQPLRQVSGHVAAVVWVGAGLAAFDRHTPASTEPGRSEGRSKKRRLSPSGEPSGVSAEEQGPTARTL